MLDNKTDSQILGTGEVIIHSWGWGQAGSDPVSRGRSGQALFGLCEMCFWPVEVPTAANQPKYGLKMLLDWVLFVVTFVC